MKNIVFLLLFFLTACTSLSSKDVMMLMHHPMMSTPVVYSENPDRDFLTNMIPHHQGAVLSSQKILEQATKPEVITLANAIIADQTKEIADFKAMIATMQDNIDYSATYTQEVKDHFASVRASMMTAMSTVQLSKDAEKDYIIGMIAHHQGAIDTSKAILTVTQNPEIRQIAKNIITAQESEIVLINKMLANW